VVKKLNPAQNMCIPEYARVERQRDVARAPVCVGHRSLKVFNVSGGHPNDANRDDDDEGKDLGRREHVLNLGRRLDVVAVDGGQSTWQEIIFFYEATF
jgi:hypothetical protein